MVDGDWGITWGKSNVSVVYTMQLIMALTGSNWLREIEYNGSRLCMLHFTAVLSNKSKKDIALSDL